MDTFEQDENANDFVVEDSGVMQKGELKNRLTNYKTPARNNPVEKIVELSYYDRMSRNKEQQDSIMDLGAV